MRKQREHHLLLAGLFAASLGLRPQIVGVGPLLPSIQHGLNISHSVAGLLPTLVILCMGLFAPATLSLAHRFGARNAIALALLLIGVFGICRALLPSAPGVIVLTVPIGIGVAVAGTLMPRAVKESWPSRPAFATGIYATGISLGAAVSAALAIPLADAFSGWRGSLIAMSAFTALLVIPWMWFTAAEPPHEQPDERPPPFLWRNAIAWKLVIIFTLTSVVYYGVNAWLPTIYVEHGWSHASSGALVTVISLVTLPVSLITAWVGDSHGSRRIYLTGAALVLVAAGIGVALLPAGGWIWAVLIGGWVGVTFPSLMTMPLDLGHDAHEVAALTAMMLGVGYAASSLSPFLFGAVRDATGTFTAVLWVIVATAGLLALASLRAPHRQRTAEPDRLILSSPPTR